MNTETKNMNTVNIIGLHIVRTPAWDNGDKLLCFFDCEANGFTFPSCLLIKTQRGGFVARPPKVKNQNNQPRSIWISDPSLGHQMMQAARRAYMALGGEGAEWTPGGNTAADAIATTAVDSGPI